MSSMKIGRFVLSVCATNCYFFYQDSSDPVKKAVVIDPADQGEQLYRVLEQKGFQVEAILLTHGHFDHIQGGDALRKLSGAKIYAWEKEQPVLTDSFRNLSQEMGGTACTLDADRYLKDGDELELAGFHIRMIGTPGHTPGGCCYYIPSEKVLFCGDTLFEGSVGRTDFPGGSMGELVRSIKDKLFALPDDTVCYTGHGGETLIGDEKKYNPYLV